MIRSPAMFVRRALLVIALIGVGRAAAAPPKAAPAWFTDITSASGLSWNIPVKPYSLVRAPRHHGLGVAWHDFDGDGDLDLYFTMTSWDFGKPRTAPTNRYYRLDAGGKYVDATAASGLSHAEYGSGCAVGDLDNDGDQDLFLANFGRDQLFLNRGNGTFTDASKKLNIKKDQWSCSAAFVDFDGDGFLDSR